MTVGERIKIKRKELCISAETIADKLGVAPATIYRYENGEIEKVPASVLVSIAEVLNVSPGYLMGWTDDPNWYTPDEVHGVIDRQDPKVSAYRETIDKISQLTPENRIRFDAYLEGLLAGQEKPSD